MMLCKSDYDANVLYQKGSKMFLLDALSHFSHLITQDKGNNQTSRDSTFLYMMLRQMSVTLPLTRYIPIVRLILHPAWLCDMF